MSVIHHVQDVSSLAGHQSVYCIIRCVSWLVSHTQTGHTDSWRAACRRDGSLRKKTLHLIYVLSKYFPNQFMVTIASFKSGFRFVNDAPTSNDVDDAWLPCDRQVVTLVTVKQERGRAAFISIVCVPTALIVQIWSFYSKNTELRTLKQFTTPWEQRGFSCNFSFTSSTGYFRITLVFKSIFITAHEEKYDWFCDSNYKFWK